MKQDLFVASKNEIKQFGFSSDNLCFNTVCSMQISEAPSYMLLSDNLLFVAFTAKIASYFVNDTKLTELSSVICEDFTPCHLEYVPSSGCLIAAGGEGGRNAVYPVLDGKILPSPHIFTHSITDSSGIVHQDGFASCNKATNNPYRIASLDKKNGTAIIANLLNNGMSVRECSRINVGKEKGISDIVFTDTDIAYILCENSGELILTDFHSGSGSLWPLKLLPFSCGSSSSQMKLSKDGHCLFCLDNSEDIISIFRLNDFSVKDLHKFSLNEKIKSFAVSHDGKTIFTAYENKLCVYRYENNLLRRITDYTVDDPVFITT